MIKIGLHAGHTLSGAGTGACSYVTEHMENRVILEYLKKELNQYKNVGWFDNTNDHAKSVVSNLKQICSNSNACRYRGNLIGRFLFYPTVKTYKQRLGH